MNLKVLLFLGSAFLWKLPICDDIVPRADRKYCGVFRCLSCRAAWGMDKGFLLNTLCRHIKAVLVEDQLGGSTFAVRFERNLGIHDS
jgi:hypothetical protein